MANNESMRTSVNKRAEFAYNEVKRVVTDEHKEVKKNYKSYSKKLMAMIRINGLALTFAFVFSKKSKERAYSLLYEGIEAWLNSPDCPVNMLYINAAKNLKNEDEKLMKAILSLDSNSYKVITKEIMEFINWLRRFAEGMIEDEKQ
ncbi:MAG: type III-B CRISPR module-associated protein Cmr5 [Defluviitoga tunisiensis]